MACQLMSGHHHLPFRLSRKCSKLIISAAIPLRSRANPAPRIHFGWAHLDLVIIRVPSNLKSQGESGNLGGQGKSENFGWSRGKRRKEEKTRNK